VITVLQPAGGVAPHRLQVAARVATVVRLDISRRHCKAVEAARQKRIGDPSATAIDIVKALSSPPSDNGQVVVNLHKPKLELARQPLVRRGSFGMPCSI
jgi:hypothetical protein